MRDGSAGDVTVLARFRPTWRQALGRGVRLGLALAGPPGLLLAAAVCTGPALDQMAGIPSRPVPPGLFPALVLVGLGCLATGVLIGVVRTRRVGTELDGRGVHRTAPALRSSGPWPRVIDIRPERRRTRTVVAVELDSGATLRLPAPFTAPLLGRDPHFERKLFTLRHVWLTHRG